MESISTVCLDKAWFSRWEAARNLKNKNETSGEGMLTIEQLNLLSSLERLSQEHEQEHTFCCPCIKLNYPATTDGNQSLLNKYFYDFIDSTNKNRTHLTTYNSALSSPLNYFEVLTVQFISSCNKLGKRYVRRETCSSFFIWFEGYFYEALKGSVTAHHYGQQGFSVQQIWQCEGADDHSTQLFVRFHHRHRAFDPLDTQDSKDREEECEVCQTQVEHARAQHEFYKTLGLEMEVGPEYILPRDELSWDKIMLRNLGLTGNEPILEL